MNVFETLYMEIIDQQKWLIKIIQGNFHCSLAQHGESMREFRDDPLASN